jgi:hypothetical protein
LLQTAGWKAEGAVELKTRAALKIIEKGNVTDVRPIAIDGRNDRTVGECPLKNECRVEGECASAAGDQARTS